MWLGIVGVLAQRIVAPFNVLSTAIEGIARTPAAARPDAVPAMSGFHEAQVLSEALRGLIRNERAHSDALERMKRQAPGFEEWLNERRAERDADVQFARLAVLRNEIIHDIVAERGYVSESYGERGDRHTVVRRA